MGVVTHVPAPASGTSATPLSTWAEPSRRTETRFIVPLRFPRGHPIVRPFFDEEVAAMATAEVRKSICPRDCPDVCSMIAQVENGRVLRVVGDPDHPITRGYLCGRFQHYEELIH